MDIYNFINSKDIRNYLKEINYEFTPVEAAWLVWQCGNKTLREKHNAWNEIINTMPDMPIKIENKNLKSLHSFLKEYMAIENKWIDEFYEEVEDVVYSCRSVNEPNTYHEWRMDYSTFKNHFTEENETLIKHNMDDAQYFCIDRLSTNEKNPYIEIKITIPQNQILEINSEELYELKYGVFFSLWFAFPTPFKKGDILCESKSFYPCYHNNPFVLLETAYDYHIRTGKILCDYTDMDASGYFQDINNGKLYGENMWTYMNLEYYTGELTGEKRILKALSNYLKGKIDVVRFSNAYHQIVLENYANSFKVLEYEDDDENLPF